MNDVMLNSNREIRVFISSTFKDMQAERNELVKFVFPQINKICEERNVRFSEVDLRWGITDEEKSEGQVLPICLEEIKNCRPYFIGILGERYGWIPQSFSEDILNREPWLASFNNRSVTELEITHGVLNNQEMVGHAFFYLRDKNYIQTLNEEDRQNFSESVDQQNVILHGLKEAEKIKDENEKKLNDLKTKIRQSKAIVRENFTSPKEFGDLVLNDLTELIDKLYPQNKGLSINERDSLEHLSFATIKSGMYVGKEKYFQLIDNYVKNGETPLLVCGESGAGKSSLLASWAIEFLSNNNKKNNLFIHFSGVNNNSSNIYMILKRIMEHIRINFGIKEIPPERKSELFGTFNEWLSKVPKEIQFIILIDGINQIETNFGGGILSWIPSRLPNNIKIILSTTKNDLFEETQSKGWKAVSIKPLELFEKKEIIINYLKLFSKRLPESLQEIIIHSRQTSNPLFLKSLLEEIKSIAENDEMLQAQIYNYLNSSNIGDLLNKIIERYEKDYDRERPGLVKDTLLLIYSSRSGLTEAELMDLLGSQTSKLPKYVWSPLYLSARNFLVNLSGKISFSHDYFKDTIKSRYLSDDKNILKYHHKILDYFNFEEQSERKVLELPFQMMQLKEWKVLSETLSDISFFNFIYGISQMDLHKYWNIIETESAIKLSIQNHDKIVRRLNFDDNDGQQYAINFGDFLNERKLFAQSQIYFDKLAVFFQDNVDFDNLELILNKILVNYEQMRNVDAAFQTCYEVFDVHFSKYLEIRWLNFEMKKEVKNYGLIKKILFNNIILHLLNFSSKKIYSINKGDFIAEIAHRIAAIYSLEGNLQSASEWQIIHYEIFNRKIYKARNVFAFSIDRYLSLGMHLLNFYFSKIKKQSDFSDIDFVKEIKKHPAFSHYSNKEGLRNFSLSKELFAKSNYSKALIHAIKAATLFEIIGMQKQLAESLNLQAEIYKEQNDIIKSIALFEEVKVIYEQISDFFGLLNSLNQLVQIYLESGNFEKAKIYLNKRLDICLNMGDNEQLFQIYNDLSRIANATGKTDEEMLYQNKLKNLNFNPLYENWTDYLKVSIFGSKMLHISSLTEKAESLHVNKCFYEALEILKEQEQECRDFQTTENPLELLKTSSNHFIKKTNYGFALLSGFIQLFLIFSTKLTLVLTNLGKPTAFIIHFGLLFIFIGLVAIYTFKRNYKISTTSFISSFLTVSGVLSITLLIPRTITLLQTLVGFIILWIVYLFISLIIAYGIIFIFKKIQRKAKTRSLKKVELSIDQKHDYSKFIKDRLQRCLFMQAEIYYYDLKMDKELIKILNEQEIICREIGDKYSLINNITMQAGILYEYNKIEDAKILTYEIINILEELENEFNEGNYNLKYDLIIIYMTLEFIYSKAGQIEISQIYHGKKVQMENRI